MPTIFLTDHDTDELVDVSQDVYDQIERLMITAVDTTAEWDTIEKALHGLLDTGRVNQHCSVIDFKADKPNWVAQVTGEQHVPAPKLYNSVQCGFGVDTYRDVYDNNYSTVMMRQIGKIKLLSNRTLPNLVRNTGYDLMC